MKSVFFFIISHTALGTFDFLKSKYMLEHQIKKGGNGVKMVLFELCEGVRLMTIEIQIAVNR